MNVAPPIRNFLRFLFLPLILVFISFAQSPGRSSSEPDRFDGPAELPRIYLKTSVADTPAPGKTWRVKDHGSVGDVLGRANCGDTIELQAGETYDGHVELPNKSCDDTHWIVIRTSGQGLPPEGKRITPCYAGVPSLPGRPPFNCTANSNVMARISGIKGQNKIIG
ncbi:MAG: hypothetical protein DMG75_05315, partial [Acidobacteria bacterium]